ncbi:MAG: nucleotidyltransferase, partial [Oscillospiraceae bacterium]|nr:nucleotidyltransferase [Oscillospiraceae bacterium]
PISELIMDRFAEFGSREFYMIVNFKKNMIRSYFSEEADRSYQLDFVEEQEFLGSGGGLCLMKGMINDTFFFSNCDTLLDVDFGDAYRQHKKEGSIITIICASKHVTVPYGVIDLAADGSVGNMREKPEFTYLTNTGVYIVEPRVVDELETKFQGFPDIIQKYRDLGERIGVYSISEDSWIDIGQLEELQRIQEKINSKAQN